MKSSSSSPDLVEEVENTRVLSSAITWDAAMNPYGPGYHTEIHLTMWSSSSSFCDYLEGFPA